MRKECKDHLGNVYSSVTDMCKCYGISQSTYYERLKTMNLEQALTFPHGKQRNSSNKVTDHLGNVYLSVSEMCKAYNISRDVFDHRIKRGWSVKDSLTIQLTEKRETDKVFDHLGNEYQTIQEMCKAYNISIENYNYRRNKQNWSLKDTLTKRKRQHSCIIQDHLGNEYKSNKEMCKAYNISFSAFCKRYYKLGWSLKDALTIKLGKCSPRQHTQDHLGNEYKDNKEMCEAYNVPLDLFNKRYYSRKWSLEESLTIPKNMYIGEYRVAECLKRLNLTFYHDCNIKKIFKDLNVTIDWKDFLESLQQNLEKAGINWSKSKIERLRPDFVLYTDNAKAIKGVIEFDGEQHQNFVEYFFKTIENFYRRVDSDFVKQDLWEYLNIPMLRIRHDQVDMIDDMVTDFVSNPSKYLHSHNTYLSENEYWSILKEEKTKLDAAFA